MRRLILSLVVGIAVALIVIAAFPPYPQFVLSRIAVAIVVAVGLNLLMGNARLFALSTPAFLAVGAYGVTIMLNNNVPLLVAIPVIIAVSWAIGWVLGTLALRLAGFYLALVTLGLLLAIVAVLESGGSLFGSGYGFAVPIPDVFGIQLTLTLWTVIAIVTASVVVILVQSLTRSRVGRAWRAMGHSEMLAETNGIDLLRLKTSTFALGSALGATGGILYAFVEGAISPDQFTTATMVSQLAYVAIGGLGSVLGSVLGPLVLISLPEFLRGLANELQIVYGVLLLAVLSFAPRGLAGLFTDLASWFGRRAGSAAPPWVTGSAQAARVAGTLITDGREPAQQARQPVARTATMLPKASASNGHVPDAQCAVEFDQVVVKYGGLAALDGLSFKVSSGNLHGLIGANGAGKTTALNAMTGVTTLFSGNLRVGELQVLGKGRIGRTYLTAAGIARTFQNPLVVPSLSATENVMLGLHSFTRGRTVSAALRLPSVSRSERWARDQSLAALERAGYTANPRIKAERLGFADLRKVELARALVMDPAIILLDEPTSGLELSAAEAMMDQLRNLQSASATPITIILVEHNVPIVFGWCDSVTAMDTGRCIVTGKPDEVRDHAGVQSAYLGQVAQEV